MGQPNPIGRTFNRGHVPPLTGTAGVPTSPGTYGVAFHEPIEPAVAPLLSDRPYWRPVRRPGMLPPEEQIRLMIEQKEHELAELRELQRTYPPTPPELPPGDLTSR